MLPARCHSFVLALTLASSSIAQNGAPVQLTAEQDHQRVLDQLHIAALRPAADHDPKSPNAVNYDESKANPYPNLPNPLLLNDGKPVTSAKVWWQQRRPQIV